MRVLKSTLEVKLARPIILMAAQRSPAHTKSLAEGVVTTFPRRFAPAFAAPRAIHPDSSRRAGGCIGIAGPLRGSAQPHCSASPRSEEHTSELQSLRHLVCRL